MDEKLKEVNYREIDTCYNCYNHTEYGYCKLLKRHIRLDAICDKYAAIPEYREANNG